MVNTLQYLQIGRKRPKYGNKKVTIQGITFDSVKEGYRWLFLQECQRRGVIKDLQRQVEFVLIPDEYEERVTHLKTKDKVTKHRVFTGVRYYADFVYMKDGKMIVEDVKGSLSSGAIDDVFIIKKKMMHSLLGIDVRIITSEGQAL